MSIPVLHRETFARSRALEFFDESELTMQIGCERDRWSLALVKELVDNGLDACEGAGVAPEITITVTRDAVTVSDNGPGMPETTITRMLDPTVRVSSNLGAYRRAVRLVTIEKQIAKLAETEARNGVRVPPDLKARVRAMLAQSPERSWDEAVWDLARGTP